MKRAVGDTAGDSIGHLIRERVRHPIELKWHRGKYAVPVIFQPTAAIIAAPRADLFTKDDHVIYVCVLNNVVQPAIRI